MKAAISGALLFRVNAAAILLFSLPLAMVLAACSSTKHGLYVPDADRGVCLMADVSSTDEVLIITNTGDRPWDSVGATLLEGGDNNDFEYPNHKEVVQAGATVTIPLNKFVREDGLGYNSAKYAMQGIMVDATNRGVDFGTWVTTVNMDRDSRGMYRNDCKPREASDQK